jgi:hypothetical protein
MLSEQSGGIHGIVKGSRLLAKIVMYPGTGPIQAEGYHANAGLFYVFTHLRSDKSAVGGQAHTKPFFCAISGNIKYILSQQRLAARKHYYRLGISRYVIQDPEGL